MAQLLEKYVPVFYLHSGVKYFPSNIDFVCPDMDKMIIFGKNDKNISSKFLDTLKLNSVFDLVTSDEEDEEFED
jgi:hypothetical protein